MLVLPQNEPNRNETLFKVFPIFEFHQHKFRCHYARYCNRECQVADWKEHKKTCEPVVLAKANGHFLSELLESVDDPLDYIIARASHKNGSVKSITVNTAGE